VSVGPVSIERVKRMNMVVVCLNQWTRFALHNLYVIEVDHENQNCYNCGKFKHIARYCRNQRNRIGKERRLEYGNGNNRERRMIKRGNG